MLDAIKELGKLFILRLLILSLFSSQGTYNISQLCILSSKLLDLFTHLTPFFFNLLLCRRCRIVDLQFELRVNLIKCLLHLRI